ncbi:MAG: deoxyribose-phosphate aldolase [Legionellales bacterium]|nr:deoxyribose-phosphate aldolase [Legionellales bacterium]
MTPFERQMEQTLSSIKNNLNNAHKSCLPFIDLTRLDHDATAADIETLALIAEQHHMAAICAFPEHLDFISPEVHLKRATVINFPSGNDPQAEILSTLEHIATEHQVDEIDYVFPYQVYLSGKQKEALKACHDVSQACHQHQLTFKVILETGELPSHQMIYQLSCEIIQQGCDFLKTSTGKSEKGATLPAAYSMLMAIVNSNSPCGIKVSGGIKTPNEAVQYMALAEQMLHRTLDPSFFRIGSSKILH